VPSNEVTEKATVYLGDALAGALGRGVDVGTTLALAPVLSRSIVWGLQSSPAVTFNGDAGPLQKFERVALSSNADVAAGLNQALPGTNPPVGAYDVTQNALRQRQRRMPVR
jgi:hypothetical protein